ncbi:MAG: mechanosensitive ion channel family protein [Bacteroidales bacterium]
MKQLLTHDWVKYTVITVGTLLMALLISNLLRMAISRFLKRSSSKLNVDHTQFNFLKNAVTFFVFLGAIIFIMHNIPRLRDLSTALFAGAGLVTAIVLFASQAAFSNIISGIFIVIFKPFRVNDLIDVGSLPKGRVEDITLRHVVILNFENRRMILPNSLISSEIVVNSSIVDEKICNFIDVGIGYESDIDRAMCIMREEAKAHPHYVDNRKTEEIAEGVDPVSVRVIELGDSAVKLRALVWTDDHSKGYVLKTDLYLAIKKAFDANGITIPYPQRTVTLKNPE